MTYQTWDDLAAAAPDMSALRAAEPDLARREAQDELDVTLFRDAIENPDS